MRWAIFEEPVVVGGGMLAPTAFGVVPGLLGKQWSLLREVDLAVAVGVALGVIKDVHGYEGRAPRLASSAALRGTAGESAGRQVTL